MKKQQHHYVYYCSQGELGYIGVRSCFCSPEKDLRYMGSSLDREFKPDRKFIIKEYPTREEAQRGESGLHRLFRVRASTHFVNKSPTCKQILAIGPDGVELRFYSLKDAANSLEMTASSLSGWAKCGKPISRGNRKGWVIKYVEGC